VCRSSACARLQCIGMQARPGPALVAQCRRVSSCADGPCLVARLRYASCRARVACLARCVASSAGPPCSTSTAARRGGRTTPRCAPPQHHRFPFRPQALRTDSSLPVEPHYKHRRRGPTAAHSARADGRAKGDKIAFSDVLQGCAGGARCHAACSAPALNVAQTVAMPHSDSRSRHCRQNRLRPNHSVRLSVCRSDVSAVPLARPSTRTVHRRTLLPMEREEGRTPIEMLGYQ
jgi:hypothetical protein